MESKLSTLGRFAPRPIELICETLNRVIAVRSFEAPIILNPKKLDFVAQPFPHPVLRRPSEAEFLNRIPEWPGELSE